jgi:predicted RNase H-like HicB family nuclease
MTDWAYLDRGRRRRTEWIPRGVVFRAIDDAGGEVDWAQYERIVLSAGYKDVRSVNRFFVGEPEPVLRRERGNVVLTQRGKSAADFFTTYWLPRLLSGDAPWPGPSASSLIHATSAKPVVGAVPSGTQPTHRLTAAVSLEPPWYVARCLEVEVTSQGRTLDDALANLKEALELYFEDMPAPAALAAPIIASVEIAA